MKPDRLGANNHWKPVVGIIEIGIETTSDPDTDSIKMRIAGYLSLTSSGIHRK